MTRKVHKPFVVAEEKDHQVIWLGLDEAEAEKGILANQYLVVDHGEAVLLDPGGYHVFERVYENVERLVGASKVVGVFYSHQDPDVAGSLNLVADFFPNARIYVSALWVRFLPHLGAAAGLDFQPIPDEGGEIPVGKTALKAIPAHFLHSPGNFTVYDPVVRTLFSGDIGAAVFPENQWYLFVEDFEEHAKYMEGFHRRYMACSRALEKWLNRVEKLEIEVIAPQHGAIMTGENVAKFLRWLRSLAEKGVGADILP